MTKLTNRRIFLRGLGGACVAAPFLSTLSGRGVKAQTVDPMGGPIDPVANVTFSEDNVKTISTPLQLMEEIGKGPLAKRIYAEKWVSFTTGRQPNGNDRCTVDGLHSSLAMDGYTVLHLLADLTQADSFRLRTREN